MGSTKEHVSACESTELEKKAKETAGEVSDSELVDSVDLSVNTSSEVSLPQAETCDPNLSRNDAAPATSKKGKKKSRHNKKGHTPAKEPCERNVIRRVHHTAAKFKQCRKRAQSFPTISKFFLPHKRPRTEAFIPPTKFLLGGNISDPLNLNSLKDENVNRAMNAVTPESSPLPTPPRHKAKIDVIIPPNIRDPLNLMEPLDNEEYEKRLEMQRRRPRKKARLRRRTTDNTISPLRVTEEDDIKVDCIKEPPPPEPSTSASKCRKRSCSDSDNASLKGKETKKLRRMDSLDKIVSPVVPQPGARKRARPQQRMSTSERPVSPHRTKLKSQSEEEKQLPKFHPKNTRYQFGNYDRYYGYRNLNAMMDIRLQVFEMHRHLFQNKDVLDIGCNVGHVSLAVARELGARSVLGVDIDPVLVGRAQRNLRSFVPVPSKGKSDEGDEKKPPEERKECGEGGAECGCVDARDDARDECRKRRVKKPKKNRKAGREPGRCFFPMSLALQFGPLGAPAAARAPPAFPYNVSFKQGNYVPREEGGSGGGSGCGSAAQFDLVLCLSTTKWMHLNWGDGGLKRAFRRMFAELRPGGKLVLEAQNWASYRKRKRLTPTIYENFNGIELFPNKFREFLLSPEVGFSTCSILGTPQHASKGFRRPIQLFVKGDFTPSKACWSDAHAPSSHHRPEGEAGGAGAGARRPVYAPAPAARAHRPSDSAPSCGAATPYSPNLDSCADDSPFYNPRSDSYAPSYQPPRPTVYASLPSPSPAASPDPPDPRPHDE